MRCGIRKIRIARAASFTAAGVILLLQCALPVADAGDPTLADLGRQLFFDRNLSASAKLACASCHDPKYAYGPPPHQAIAIGGSRMDQMGMRAVPSLRYLERVPPFSERAALNGGEIGPAGGFTWDGRAPSLHEQARIPLLAPKEMANESPEAVVERLRHRPYARLFRRLFGADVFQQPERAFEQALLALEAFQHTPSEFYPYSSKYDAYLRGEVALSEQEQRGLEVFNHPDRGNCADCHSSLPDAGGAPPIFTDFQFENLGVPRNPRLPANADPQYYDMGLCGPERHDLAANARYCGRFRTPTLRNVALRDAFFHNGVFDNLRQALKFYQQRDVLPWNWYPRRPDGTIDKVNDLPVTLRGNLNFEAPFDGREGGQIGALSDDDIDDLLAFLNTLTDGYQAPAKLQARAERGR